MPLIVFRDARKEVLIDRGNQLRYYCDEGNNIGSVAPNNERPVLDHGPRGEGAPMDLKATDDASGYLGYSAEDRGGMGLKSTNVGGNQTCDHTLTAGDKFLRNFIGSKVLTVEVHAKVTDGSSGGGRLFAINHDSSANNQLGFNCSSTTSMQFWYEGSARRTFDPGEDTNTWTAVVDTSLGGNDNVKIYKNGVFFTTTINSNPADDDTFSGPTAGYLIKMFNRGTGGRSIVGILQYAAMYSEALSPAEVLHNHEILVVNNDIPGDRRACILVSAGGAVVKVLDKTVQVAEGIVVVTGLNEVLDATVEIAESFVPALALARVYGSTVEASEGLARAMTMARIYDATVEIAEGIVAITGLNETLNATVEIAGGSVLAIGLTKILDATMEVSEGSALALGLTRVIDETVEVSEGLARAMTMARIYDATVEISEGIVPALGLVRIYDETVEISEDFIKVLAGGEVIKVLDETVEVSEGFIRTMGLVRIYDETIDVGEGFIRTMGLVRIYDETVELSEGIISALGLVRIYDETVELSEGAVLSLGILQVLSSTVEISEGLVSKVTLAIVTNAHVYPIILSDNVYPVGLGDRTSKIP